MFTLRNLCFALTTGVLLTSCSNNTTNEGNTSADSVSANRAIELADIPASPEFPDAQIKIGNVMPRKINNDSVEVTFSFDVRNYDLKSQTADAGAKQCNNSDKGQHIHFILDNKPYAALYEPTHKIVLAPGSEHYLLVFLSRSYHESVKSPGAAAVYHFKVNENGRISKLDDPTTPMVFYSRPKGDYIGKDTENLLFDFYVWNTALSEGGNKVKAEIKGDGLDTTLTISNWKPQFLKNMPMGKSSIKLTLVDSEGNKVEGPETEVTREFTLSKDEPIAAN